ncbi:methylenetetrahydrofolate reductase [NAD(P)H] [Christensenellaceae bacterium OttesenSCG-928-M15]|nr:methylenetetrahydrofolate reductase [NAD(P)H] [Christensenellaceae bacterium OttesenSCG-928-M15]
MLIKDLLRQNRITVSCELFPPKKDKGFDEAEEVVKATAALDPDFISVTYGANGGAHKNTMKMVEYIESLGQNALAHLTCFSSTHDQIASLATDMKARGIQNVLALRGDKPKDWEGECPDHYRYAVDLVHALKKEGGFCIGAACYPEGHVDSANVLEDIRYLKEKVDAGCDFLTTQMFFDNNILYKFLYKIREKGITVPVIAGIMPVTNKRQIKRIVEMSGTALPPRFENIVDRFGDNNEAMQQAGIAYATEQIIDLIANGVNGVHIYTMNKPHIAKKIMENISCVVRAAS